MVNDTLWGTMPENDYARDEREEVHHDEELRLVVIISDTVAAAVIIGLILHT